MNRQTIAFATDHPTGPGHFPDHPIIPGVVLLQEIAAVMAPQGQVLRQVAVAKFLHPVRPGQAIVVAWDNADMRFTATLVPAGPDVVTGALRFGSP